MVLAKPFGGVASPRISPSPGPPSVPRQTVTLVAVWWEGADGGPWPLGAGAGGGLWRSLAAALLLPPLRPPEDKGSAPWQFFHLFLTHWPAPVTSSKSP